MKPFIHNHQFNAIKRSVDTLQRTYNTVADKKVIEAAKYSAEGLVEELFKEKTAEQEQLFKPLFEHKSKIEYDHALNALQPYLLPLSGVTEGAIKKLFPKVKKLKVPDLSALSFVSLTYLGWIDAGSNKLYMVYDYQGKVAGIEARFTIAGKKNICSLCNGYGEVALVTAISKAKLHNSPDYYKAVGNYMCTDSMLCNTRITDITYLEKFFEEIICS
ncbi:elongation factor G-binding protein [Paenibacillus sp. FSL H8-0548]|uniref:FusB/FusC family EF-G-binding protein n=1 Tax=Paenibacillus sp. FSL H8-0548 TaxID=1920422 RepID=UPI00096CC2E9|nr:FusB/FusC family EF-G-binding protein [Paenibacillus sp. FSL H8-0548]OMF36856.1 elongation factor G-binding protein [Paenibacillus sp. FSL H8-0548]